MILIEILMDLEPLETKTNFGLVKVLVILLGTF